MRTSRTSPHRRADGVVSVRAPDDVQIGARLELMGREGVAQRMNVAGHHQSQPDLGRLVKALHRALRLSQIGRRKLTSSSLSSLKYLRPRGWNGLSQRIPRAEYPRLRGGVSRPYLHVQMRRGDFRSRLVPMLVDAGADATFDPLLTYTIGINPRVTRTP